MLQRLLRGRARHGLREYLARTIKKEISRLLYPIDVKTFVKGLQSLGVEKGVTLCCHSSLNRLGYVVGGPETVIDAIIDAVGPNGCVIMPTFSMAGTQESFISENESFDVQNTPSMAGLITETFRLSTGVLRSLHPTVSVAGCGNGIDEILAGHEESVRPYGRNTPYGRLVDREDTFILMLETHIQSLLHHLQDRVDFPNLFLPGLRRASIVNYSGNTTTMLTKVMRPRVPYFVAIPSSTGKEPEWARIQDFSLIFPSRRVMECKSLGYRFEGYPKLYERRKYFESQKIFRSTRVGCAEIGLLHVKGFISLIEPELIDLIDKFRKHYDVEHIAGLNMPLPGG
jgi:aminoglycoside N3'-acetyltransferase